MRDRLLKVGAGLLICYGVVLAVAHVWALRDVAHRPCPERGAVVLVDAGAGVLCLCADGRVERTFRAAVGRGGLDKRAEGDGRTPSGMYDLGTPRRSRRYHVFVPVAYPTDEQRRAGFSGSDIGLHGPHVACAWLRHATVWLNWTRGCIAVGTASEADQIANWVRTHASARLWVT